MDANRGWVIGVINRNIQISRLKYDAKIKTKVAAGKSSGGHESPMDKVAKASKPRPKPVTDGCKRQGEEFCTRNMIEFHVPGGGRLMAKFWIVDSST